MRSRRSSERLELSAQDSLVDLEEMLLTNENSTKQRAQEDQQRNKATAQGQALEA